VSGYDTIFMNGRYAVFHRPHPDNEIYVTDLKRIRRFLVESGAVDKKQHQSMDDRVRHPGPAAITLTCRVKG